MSVTDTAALHNQGEDLVDVARNMGILQQDQHNINRFVLASIVLSSTAYRPELYKIYHIACFAKSIMYPNLLYVCNMRS